MNGGESDANLTSAGGQRGADKIGSDTGKRRPRMRPAILIPYVLIVALVSGWLFVDGPLQSEYELPDVGDSIAFKLESDAFSDVTNNKDDAESAVTPLSREALESGVHQDWCKAIDESLKLSGVVEGQAFTSLDQDRSVCLWSSRFMTATFTIDTSKADSPSKRMEEASAAPPYVTGDQFKARAGCMNADYRESLSDARAWHVKNDFALFNFNNTCVYEIAGQPDNQVVAVAGFTAGEPGVGGWESGPEEWGYGMFASVSTSTSTQDPETGSACCDQVYVVRALEAFLSNALPAFYEAVPAKQHTD